MKLNTIKFSQPITLELLQMVFSIIICTLCFPLEGFGQATDQIYHKGWTDFNKNELKDIYEDPEQKIDLRIANLLSQMTLEEKTCQLATLYGYGRVLKDELPTPQWSQEIWKDGIANIDEHLNSVTRRPATQTDYSFPHSAHAKAINEVQKWFVEKTRLGIPVDFTNEGIRGLCHDRATPLPSPIAVASSWDRNLLNQAGNIIGKEAKALGYTNIYAPILDVARDPRWGRIVETYGESPYLIAELGKQLTLGIQQNGVASTLKHFAAYSVPKGGRDGNARTDPHIAPRELHELYLYPFKRVIQEAGALGIMSSYNDWDGVPVTASHYFLTDLLRKEYGFKGYVVSDSEAVEYIYEKHHVAQTYKEGVRQAVEAGLNVRTTFSSPEVFINPLRELVKEGSLSVKTLDERVADVLRVKFSVGLFDHPYVEHPEQADKIVYDQQDKLFTEQVSKEVLVLLKNRGQLLPLHENKLKRILVTGPLAAEVDHSISRYGPSNIQVVSILEGIRKRAGNGLEVLYAKGCEVVDAHWPQSEILTEPLTSEEQKNMQEAVALARDSDVVVAVLGETQDQVGESRSRTSLEFPGHQRELLQALRATGKPIVLVLINGRPLTINWANVHIPSILEAWFPGASGGTAVAGAIFGDFSPGGKLPVTFPKSVGQIPLNFPFKPASQAGQPNEGPNGSGRTRVLGALYPFGHGLSYTTFEYNKLRISLENPGVQQIIEVNVDITNTGNVKGDEVVQLYLRDLVSSVTTYDSRLRGFERVTLEPGETKTVRFVLSPDNLALLDKNMNYVVEPGEFEILIGSSSEDIRLSKKITCKAADK